ncbi:hypothetical protein [Nonomuraea rubra]|uniref:hypothetical protein n=1 Tax=Nonomuraea rubra TaxID=46180 RepID=UPI0031E8F3DF
MRVVGAAGRLATVGGGVRAAGVQHPGAAHRADRRQPPSPRPGATRSTSSVIEAPRGLALDAMAGALTEAGGQDVVIVPARVKDLTDPGVQALVAGAARQRRPGPAARGAGRTAARLARRVAAVPATPWTRAPS